MADTQIHTCSDCAVLSCKAKDEAHYPAFCLTAKQNQARLEEALKIYQEDPEQGNIARLRRDRGRVLRPPDPRGRNH